MSNQDTLTAQTQPDATTLMPELPDAARLWIYGSDRPLTSDEEATIIDRMRSFLEEWTSHGRDVAGATTLVAGRFLIIGAHIPSGDISGCGIDKSSRVVATLSAELGLEWVSALHVFYRDQSGVVQCVSRPEFRANARSGKVTGQTPVYDFTISELGQLRRGDFLRPAAETWHGRAFGLTTS